MCSHPEQARKDESKTKKTGIARIRFRLGRAGIAFLIFGTVIIPSVAA